MGDRIGKPLKKKAERALKLNPKDESVYYALSEISEHNKDVNSAIEFLELGLKIEDGNILQRERLINLLCTNGKSHNAINHLKFLIEKFPQHKNCKQWVKVSSTLGNKIDLPKRNVNACLIIPEILSEIDCVISNKINPTTSFLYSLNSLVEAITFHDIIFVEKGIFKGSTGELRLHPNLESRPLTSLLEEKQLLIKGPLSFKPRHPAHRLFTMVQQAIFFEGSPPLFSMSPKEASDMYELFEALIREDGPEWYNFDFLEPDKREEFKDRTYYAKMLIESQEVIADNFGLFFYTNLYTLPYRISSLTKKSLVLNSYNKFSKHYYSELNKICNIRGYSFLPIPPLTTILLGRCKTKDDIPTQLMKLRDDFKYYRVNLTKYENELDNAENFGEELEILQSFDESWQSLIKKIEKPTSWILHKSWDVVKGITPIGMLKEIGNKIKEKDKEERLIYRLQGLHDAWGMLLKQQSTKEQISNVERLFSYSPDEKELKMYSNLTFRSL